MTKHNIIRILAGLSFLIFFCPFLQMCSDGTLHKVEVAQEIVVENTQTEDSLKYDSESTVTTETFDKKEEKTAKSEKGFTINGYELALASFKNPSNLTTLSDIFDIFSFYALIVLLSIIIFISALRKKLKSVFWLSIINLLSGITPILMFLTDATFEVNQIKFGYYLFILNTLALIIFSKKYKAPDAV